MPVREPAWWYLRRITWPARLLRPFADIYGAIVVRRYRSTESYRSSLPVICVGNFTVGGTGKTPLTQTLVERLAAFGARPAILSRGYGGRERGPRWVDPAADTAARVGDEPRLLAASAPVMVARDRAAGARAIEADPRGFTHIVMDDGLQNPSLAKSLAIAVVDGGRGFGNGAVLPAGPLRAPLAFQLPLVDAVVVNCGLDLPAPADRAALGLPDGPFLVARVTAELTAALRDGGPLFAFAGIGVPDRFFATLRALGCTLVETRAYRDHHPFSERDAQQLLARARELGATLVTTEKDLARLTGYDGARGSLGAAAQALAIRLTFAEPHASDFDRLLRRVL